MKKLFAGIMSVLALISLSFAADAKSDYVVWKTDKGEAKIKKNPKKLVVMDLGILDTLDALGVKVQLAVPTDSLKAGFERFKKGTTNIGGLKKPNIEKIYSFKPDAIFMAGRQKDFHSEFSKIAPTVFNDIMPATYVQQTKDNVIYLGEVFGLEDLAQEKIAQLDKKIAEAKELISKSDLKALIVLTNDGSISAFGANSRFGLLYDFLGGASVDTHIKVSGHGQEAGYEYISKMDPDIIFYMDRTQVAGGSKYAKDTLNNDLVNQTKAAKNGKILPLDPTAWYLSAGGYSALIRMIDDVTVAYK